jgi:hypothetical protein
MTMWGTTRRCRPTSGAPAVGLLEAILPQLPAASKPLGPLRRWRNQRKFSIKSRRIFSSCSPAANSIKSCGFLFLGCASKRRPTGGRRHPQKARRTIARVGLFPIAMVKAFSIRQMRRVRPSRQVICRRTWSSVWLNSASAPFARGCSSQ